jgi:hypothetical protein
MLARLRDALTRRSAGGCDCPPDCECGCCPFCG